MAYLPKCWKKKIAVCRRLPHSTFRAWVRESKSGARRGWPRWATRRSVRGGLVGVLRTADLFAGPRLPLRQKASCRQGELWFSRCYIWFRANMDNRKGNG